MKGLPVLQDGMQRRQVVGLLLLQENLNKSLKKERKTTKRKQESTLPVLKQPKAFTNGSGILSRRQRTWVEANPNEPYIENPTYLRLKLHCN